MAANNGSATTNTTASNTNQLNGSATSQNDNYSNMTMTTNNISKVINENMTTSNTVTLTVPTTVNHDMSRKQSVAVHQTQSTTAIIQSSTMPTSQSSIMIKRRPENNETVFKVYKGVKTFDFSMEKNLLITGGKLISFTFVKQKFFFYT